MPKCWCRPWFATRCEISAPFQTMRVLPLFTLQVNSTECSSRFVSLADGAFDEFVAVVVGSAEDVAEGGDDDKPTILYYIQNQGEDELKFVRTCAV